MAALGVGGERGGVVGLRGLMKKQASGFSLSEKGMGDSVCSVQSDPRGHLGHPSGPERRHGSCKFGRHHL